MSLPPPTKRVVQQSLSRHGEHMSPHDRLHELERMRRSIAMLEPGTKALSREDAMKLIAELEDVERRMRDLRAALAAVMERRR